MTQVLQDEGGTQNSTPTVLIAGASFAGLTAAWWMYKLSYKGHRR